MADDTARILEGEVFEGETFRGGDLAEADLAGKELVRCAFENVRLTQSRWRDARLEDCTFDGCELTRIEPGGLLARGVRFVGCKMMGIDWSRVGTFPTLAFESCDLRYGSFVSLRLPKLVFDRCNL
ncbi:MAG TPA: pentapeptide repeat-containing protein, partial [Polyangia bacterium]|nr:pentapeptide repeat-containing protein [Polyangia bacterium]